jgi:Succinylglutamate desuccinylase / Aspartoacylase family
MQPHHRIAVLLLAGVAVVCVLAGAEFLEMRSPDVILPGPGVTGETVLSAYHSSLGGTKADTRIYEFDSGMPGGTMLVVGGTHPNESAGFMAAVVLVENARVTHGRLLVMPQASASGFTCTDPLEGTPQFFTIRTAGGSRRFRYGARGTSPTDQFPDPLVYLHHPSGQRLSGKETRNLNRSYPGRPEGTMTEQVAYAITRLIQEEHVDIAIDLHEAAPEYPVVNAIVTHEKGREIAAAATLNLEFSDLHYTLEMSPVNLRGLSHREWGDWTPTIPFLMETANVLQGRLRGATTPDLLVEGRDRWYVIAAISGNVRVPYDTSGIPLARRVGRHLQGIREIAAAFNEFRPSRTISLDNVPEFRAVTTLGVGAFLR